LARRRFNENRSGPSASQKRDRAVIVVLDAGTGGGKCAIFDLQGRLRALHREPWGYTVHVNPDFPSVREFGFDPGAFWGILCRCVRAALRAADVRAGDVVGVTTTSQREGCVFLDASGQEIYAGPNLDSRGFLEGIEVLSTLGGDRLYAITGHSAPFIFPLARVLWFRKNDPRPIAHVLMINDWMSYRLTGVVSAEPSNATESMLFDLRQQCWSREIIDRFTIPADILPPLYRPGQRLGAITRAAAATSGLAPGTPVFVGGADTQCSLLGAGAVEAGDTAAILGTTTPVQTVVPEPTFDPAATLWAGCHVVPDRWVLESNVGDTGDAYNWVLDLVVPQKEDQYAAGERLARAHDEGDVYSFVGPRIFDLTKMSPSKPGGVLFPFPVMHLRPHPGQLLRACLASVGYAVRANLDQLRTLTLSPERLVAGGGMCRNRLLLELLATITSLPVHQAEEPESTALGGAMLVAAGIGAYADASAAVRAMGRYRVVEPDQSQRQRYDTGYRRWRQLYDSLEAMMIE